MDPNSSRRSFLGSAALGASGLAMLATQASAEGFKPGDGGFGRKSMQLPAGQDVVYHDPTEVGGMPEFVHALDGGKPKVTSGGWAKESTVKQLPIMKGLAGVHMFLDPGASRELHWHAIAAEWAFIIEGQCQTMVLDPSGQSEVNNFGPGDLWYFPKGHGHAIQTIGDKPCHFLLSFDNGAFSEHGTFSITDWVDVTPKDMLALNFGIPKDLFDAFPKGETYIKSGPILHSAQATDSPWPKDSTHKFALMREAKARREFDGGSFRLATVDEWPASKDMSGGLMIIKPGAMKELHWNPNANEFNYYLRGKGQIAAFGSGGRGKVSDVKAGDSAYLPAGFGHAIRNTGDTDLEIVQTWDAGQFQEITLKDWINASPSYLVANNFAVPDATLSKIRS